MNQYITLIPEIFLISFGTLTFLYGVVKRHSNLIYLLGAINLFFSIGLVIAFSKEFSGGLIKTDIFANLFRIIILIIGILIIALSYEEMKRSIEKGAEYIYLLTLAIFGMNMMVLANDILLLYLALEAFSLPMYILAGFYKSDKRSVEAGIKYFILGTLASILLIASMVFFYANTGSTSYEAFKLMSSKSLSSYLSLIFLISTFAFKLSLVPFHAWSPDVYQGSPTPVTAFFSTAPKVAVLGALIKILLLAHHDIKPHYMIIALSALSMIVGNILALRQSDLKRLFAYSSVAHAGYISMALLLKKEAILTSALPYIIVYVLMNVGVFAVILSMAEGEKINNYKGLNKVSPLTALSMTVILISLTGLPPTAGFIVKFNLFKNVFLAGYEWLVLLGLCMSILSAFYYLRIVFFIYEDFSTSLATQNKFISRSISLFSASLLIIAGLIPQLIMIY
ncbi:MAG: NADH-quinone oxidoreductase subunit N [Thermodesulfovibrionales bacterium]|nr:NADH-quinone oxidoreductase subunit N [Thermodesulfovibrionales bacterium]